MTPFRAIMRAAVEATPGAIGAAFADAQGEMIDAYSTSDPHEWAVLTATYGVVLAQLHSAFGTWHFGGPEWFISQHARLGVIVHAVHGNYYALIAVDAPGTGYALGHALFHLRDAAHRLEREIA